MRVVMHRSVPRSGDRVTACDPSGAGLPRMFRVVVAGPLAHGSWPGRYRRALGPAYGAPPVLFWGGVVHD